MILTELRGYGPAENDNSVNSTNAQNTSLERAWRDYFNDTKYSILPNQLRASGNKRPVFLTY